MPSTPEQRLLVTKEREGKKLFSSQLLLKVIDLAQYGKEVDVCDNGSGISPSDFANVARKHQTVDLHAKSV
jgi:hypothetical protein